MIRRIPSYLVAVGFALAASQALANTVSFTHSVDLSGFTYGPATVATVQSSKPGTLIAPFKVWAGQYSGTLDGTSFTAYCAEITQYLHFNTLYTDYTIVDGKTAWGDAKSAMFDRTISAFIGANINSNAVGTGLMQAAIWEILYETAPTYGFASGTFDVASSNNLPIQLGAVDWLAVATAPVRYHADLLRSPSAQDLMLITTTSLPEPSSYALLIAGLAGFAFVARRRALQR